MILWHLKKNSRFIIIAIRNRTYACTLKTNRIKKSKPVWIDLENKMVKHLLLYYALSYVDFDIFTGTTK